MRHELASLADAVGRGLLADLVGTAAMTLSSMVEMKMRGRSASKTPAQAICKTLGLETVNDQAQERLNNLVHWAYGTAWGALRGVIAAAGIQGLPATLIHLSMLWGGGAGDVAADRSSAANDPTAGQRDRHRRMAPPGLRPGNRSSLRLVIRPAPVDYLSLLTWSKICLFDGRTV